MGKQFVTGIRKLHEPFLKQKSNFKQRMRIAVRAVNSTSQEAAEVQRSFISKAY